MQEPTAKKADLTASAASPDASFQAASGEFAGSAEKDGAVAATGSTSFVAASGENLNAATGSEHLQTIAEDVTETFGDSPSSVPAKAPQQEERAFKPEPLHVRYLCKAEKRRTVELIAKDDKKIAELEDTLAEEKGDKKRQEIQTELDRLQYQKRINMQRVLRLDQLNPRTHAELPQQLIAAARDGDAEFVKLAFEAKVDIDVQDKELAVTPLIAATIANKVSVMTVLLELKADPRIQDINGATCAHYAVQLDHVHALAAILDAFPGENWDTLTIKDARQKSAVDYARRPEREGCLRLLQSRMGGPVPIVWQVFKGWVTDILGLPRHQKDTYRCFSTCSNMSFAKAAKGRA